MRCSRNSFSFLRNSRSCGDIIATGAGTFVCGASGGALDADGRDAAGPSGIGADTGASPRLFVLVTRGAMIAFSTLVELQTAAFSGESLMASEPMCRKIPTLRASSREGGIAPFPRHRCEQPLALDLQDLVIENLSTVMQLLAFKAARLSAFSGFRQRGTRRRTIASTFRETEEGSPLRGSSSATVTSRTRARAIAPALFPGALVLRRSIIHATHAATGHGRHRCLFLRSLGDHRLCGDEQPCNRGCILQRGADHLGRINDPVRHEVFELAGLRVEAEGMGVVVLDLADHHRAVFACVDRNLSRRPRERFFDHLDAVPLVFVFAPQLLQRLAGAQQSDTTPGENAFLNRGPGRMHGIVNAVLAFLHLDLSGATDADHGNPARKLRQPLLQLLTIVVGGSFLDLRLDLSYTSLNIVLLAGTTHDRGVLLLDRHLLGTAKHIDRHVLKLDTEVRGHHGTAS